MADRSWSISWNVRARQFFARYRKFWVKPGEAAWGTKRLPSAFLRHQELDAERWMIDWYAKYQRGGGAAPDHREVVPASATIALLAERWLKYRHDDAGTARNTFVGYRRILRNWILTNDRFEHVRIDDLDIERELVPSACLAWVRSLKGKPSTRVRYADVLAQLVNDCIVHEWVSRDMYNPMQHPVVARHLGAIRVEAEDERTTVFLSAEQVAGLLTKPSSKVIDYRRVRYLLVLATGLRDGEVQGLVWSDLHLDEAVPYLYVARQLLKVGPKPFIHERQLPEPRKSTFLAWPTAVVGDPKKKSRRPMPLPPIVVEVLRFWWKQGWKRYVGRPPERDDPVFPAGERNSRQEYGCFCNSESPELLRKDLERLGVSSVFTDPATHEEHDLTFHGLRHTFATMLDGAGVERRRIDELLGHCAAKVADKHYIGTLVEARAVLVAKLPLPTRVQMRGCVIEVDGPRDPSPGDAVPLPQSTQIASRPPRAGDDRVGRRVRR